MLYLLLLSKGWFVRLPNGNSSTFNSMETANIILDLPHQKDGDEVGTDTKIMDTTVSKLPP